jgi:hypothetical protein
MESDQENREPICELIGGVPFVTPYEGYVVPWFLEPILEEAREIGRKLDNPLRFPADLRETYRNQVQRYVAVVERRIGVTPDQVIAATKGLSFGPQDEDAREQLRQEIRWKRRLLAYRAPSAGETPDMTETERKTLEKIERRRRDAEIETRAAKTPEEQTKAYDRATKAGDEALALMEKIRTRQESHWAAQAIAEIDQLAKLRKEDLEELKTGGRRRVSPLDRLLHNDLIDRDEHAAGVRYGKTWQRLYGGKTGDGTGCGDLDPLESRIADLKRLDEARGYAIAPVGGRALTSSGLGGDARLIMLCDDICGAEKSLREAIGTSAHKRKVAMERLKTALGLLALHYGLRKTHEDELRAA